MTGQPAVIECLYGIEAGHYDGNDEWQPQRVVAFRITKKTARRIYYDANLTGNRAAQIRFVPRQLIEAEGTVCRKSAGWWESDLQLWLEPPQTWPPKQQPDLNQLKSEMAAAHPDRGGTDEAFIAARRRYEDAKAASTPAP
jgi:hypothetical protein